MAKITTIIDIGSNSMRMVVFKKTSQFGFHLINETKSKIKISQNSYENSGYLQEDAMQRAYDALDSFLTIAHNLKSRKIVCVATSAMRDAPNAHIFLTRVRRELSLHINVIDGKKEAYFGGIATSNLLANKEFTTIDIGGGSTEFALVQKRTVVETHSLDIGTVRLQELYFDKGDLEGAKRYILQQLQHLPSSYQQIGKAVGLGGTARALTRSIIKTTCYPFETIHGYTYETQRTVKLFESIIEADSNSKLKTLAIKKDRYDTIKTGAFIFKTILEYLSIKEVTTSGVGVREGVYLTDILRNNNHKFPKDFHISVRSLMDRFVDDTSQTAYLGNNISKLFDVLAPLHHLDKAYKPCLILAAKLQQIGIRLNFYKNTTHSANFILHGLHYGFTHQERILISTIIQYSKKNLPSGEDIERFKTLLPDLYTLQWLSYIHSLNKVLNHEYLKYKYNYRLDEKILYITSQKRHYIILDMLQKLKKPKDFEVKFIH